MPRRQKLTKMEIDRVDLVDAGANGRRFALFKSADVQTFAQLQAVDDVGDWLTPALDTLAQVVWSAMHPADGDDEITVEQRLAAVAVSCDEFKEQLVVKVGEAIGLEKRRAGETTIAKQGRAVFAGIL